MIFRNETAATKTATTAEQGNRKRNRVRAAVVAGSAVAVLPVAGLVAATSASAADVSTWDKVAQATKAQQIAVAEKVLASQGPGAWPVCSVQAGLTQGGAAAQVDTSSTGSSASSSKSTPSTSSSSSSTGDSSTSNTSTKSAKPATTQTDSGSDAASANTSGSGKYSSGQGHQSWKKSSTATTSGGSYTVKSGDTLGAIAAANGTTVDALYSANAQVIGASADVIYPGQVLSL
ncbi:LysM peptidoglycan-binding domain-containing protein [Kitasatospora sp. NRRL B-11411]|uniref:LysM peptidoglycan-binding domain-containing protein n=1 Tax=Kitasatospora sp. NRRL B-11411 TaxID=1463822 RepID=UPI000690ACAC|nr:LysM peptidoglycan-binding domain-containing protein [Kitasatospora sp. NRRL B-11411]